MTLLQGRIRGDKDWTDIPNSTHPQRDLETLLERMRAGGFKVRETDAGWKIVNTITKQVECEYRLW